MRIKLTKKIVDALAAPEQGSVAGKRQADVLRWDTEVPGFGVKLTAAGRKSYFVYYRTTSGQQRRPKIGEHGLLTVDQARAIARQWLAQAAAGGDISLERQDKRSAGTVAELARRYLSDYAKPHKKPRSVQTDRANIDNHVVPLIGTMPVRDVTRQDVDRMKVAISEGKTARTLPAKSRGRRKVRGGKGIANRVVALVSKMFACAQEWGLRSDNPAAGVRKYRERRKDRFLDSTEVSRLLIALDAALAESALPTKAIAAIRVMLFTGMRYSEVMGLRWRDVDDDHQCFRLADSKTNSRVIPFGQLVQTNLALLVRRNPEELVFEGSLAGSPLALRPHWYVVRNRAELGSDVTLHTLRHTFASWSVMGGLSLAQVGALLGHKSAQTTLRYADHAVDALRAYNEQTSTALAAMAAPTSSS